MSSPRITTLLAAAAISVAAAAPASADSIAYLKGGDVWLTTTTMDRQFQVTTGGGYLTVSQADDGTLLTTKADGNLHRLDRLGRELSSVSTLGTACAGSAYCFKGPLDADVSPDGTKAAYGFYYSGYTTSPSGTYVNDGNATAFTSAAADTQGKDGFKTSREYDAPEWIDDATVLLSNGPGYPSSPIAVAQAGSGDSRSWFYDSDNLHPQDGTISRSKRLVAAVSGDRRRLYLYRDQDGQPLGDVDTCVFFSDDTGDFRYSSPTFNADGTRLVWANGHALYSATAASADAMCDQGAAPVRVLDGASNPDWGPADVPTGRPAASGAPGAPAKGTSTTAPNGGILVAEPAAGSLTLGVRKTSLRAALRNGLTLTVTAPAGGSVSVSAKAKGTLVASGRTTAKRAGKVAVTLRFTRKARKKLARAKTVSLSITATQGSARQSGSLTLRR